MNIEDIVEYIDNIHLKIDVDEAKISYDTDEEGNEIIHTPEEKVVMYEKLLDELHNIVFDLARGIAKGKLPPPVYIWKSVDEELDIGEIQFHPKWDHHNK